MMDSDCNRTKKRLQQKKRTSGTPFLPYAQAASIVTLALSPVALNFKAIAKLQKSKDQHTAYIQVEHFRRL
jgi:hypothetical protein